MWTTFIRLRKKAYLPFKFWMERNIHVSRLKFPPMLLFIEKSDEIRTELLRAEREGDTSKINHYKGATEIINWIMAYGETNEKRDAS